MQSPQQGEIPAAWQAAIHSVPSGDVGSVLPNLSACFRVMWRKTPEKALPPCPGFKQETMHCWSSGFSPPHQGTQHLNKLLDYQHFKDKGEIEKKVSPPPPLSLNILIILRHKMHRVWFVSEQRDSTEQCKQFRVRPSPQN